MDVNVPISDEGIAISEDKKYKFKNFDLSRQWINVEQERFINWMKISPFSDVRKTWGRINSNLPKGNYKLNVFNNWNSYIFDGKKYFGLTEVNGLGGQNDFLGISFLVMGSISIIFAILFLIRKIQRPKGILEY